MSEYHKKHCKVCDKPFERNNYYFGKLMKVQDFKTEQNYFNEKRWLINRMVHGWGVVCGLDVEPIDNEPNKVRIKPGLAIDCCGREILVCKSQVISLETEETEYNEENLQQTSGEERYLICLKFKECKTESFPISGSCDQEEKYQFNRIKDWFEIKVIQDLNQENEEKQKSEEPFCPKKYGCNEKKLLHQCICDRLKICQACDHPQCIILATVTSDKNSPPIIDVYSDRKLVYNSPLLYDLISCYHGDLPRVCNINWEHEASFAWKELHNVVGQGLRVTFNKPMRKDTINSHTFQIAAITVEERTGYRLFSYIPGDIKVNDEGTEATFVFEQRWIDDEVWGEYNPAPHSGLADGAEFEIILKGSSIFSMDGKALDGCFKGNLPNEEGDLPKKKPDLPSGTGTQGSNFVSWISVKARSATPKGGYR